jgi:hypothetical protein
MAYLAGQEFKNLRQLNQRVEIVEPLLRFLCDTDDNVWRLWRPDSKQDVMLGKLKALSLWRDGKSR